MRACLVLTISLSAGEMVASAQRGDAATREPAVQEILLRAGSFVQKVSASLTGVLAEESYEQDLFAYPFDTGARPRIGRRSMGSEALFLWLPAANEWMFVRNVLAVDGRPVPDSGERLDRLFKDPPGDTAAYLRGLQRENARFDIGPVFRTLGDPTFALRYLEPESQGRFAFSRTGNERVGAVRATTLAYRERRRPYVVKVDGMDAQSSGTMWINAAEGAVIRTNLRVLRPSGRGFIASITVDFQTDPRNRTRVVAQYFHGVLELMTDRDDRLRMIDVGCGFPPQTAVDAGCGSRHGRLSASIRRLILSCFTPVMSHTRVSLGRGRFDISGDSQTPTQRGTTC